MNMNIYDELRSGRTADEIAKAFTEQLNAAEARIKDEEAKAAAAAEALAKEEAKRVAAIKAEAKRADFISLLEDAFLFCNTHYPELGLEVEDADEETLGAIADMLLMVLDLEVVKHKTSKNKINVDFKFKAPNKVEDPFAAFFKEMGL